MTDKEVMKLAQKLITDFKCESDTMVDFCNTVIEKFEQQPCEDAISRTEAIENFASWYGYDYNNQGYYRLLKQMPSVTPSYNSIKTELKPSGDCISREEALKVMCDKCPMYNCVTGCSSYRHIEKMPSVQPQPKKGKWIEVWDKDHLTTLAYKCSECGTMRNVKTSYCSDCGADMRGEKV